MVIRSVKLLDLFRFRLSL